MRWETRWWHMFVLHFSFIFVIVIVVVMMAVVVAVVVVVVIVIVIMVVVMMMTWWWMRIAVGWNTNRRCFPWFTGVTMRRYTYRG